LPARSNRVVYARHGRELSGVKVPCRRISVQMLERYRSRETTATSLRQGRSREGGSGGSQRQTCETTNRNVIEGRDFWVSWHNTTKPTGSGSTVAGCLKRKCPLLPGDLTFNTSGIYGFWMDMWSLLKGIG